MYDLCISEEFTPKVVDGEVEAFSLWDVDKVIEMLLETPQVFKPDAALGILHFFMHHNILHGQNTNDFHQTQTSMYMQRSFTQLYQ